MPKRNKLNNKTFIEKILVMILHIFKGKKIETLPSNKVKKSKVEKSDELEKKLNNLSTQLSDIFCLSLKTKPKNETSAFDLWVQDFFNYVRPDEEQKLVGIDSLLVQKLQFPYDAQGAAKAIVQDINNGELHTILNLSHPKDLLKMSDIEIVEKYQIRTPYYQLGSKYNLVPFFQAVLENNKLPQVSQCVDSNREVDQKFKKSD